MTPAIVKVEVSADRDAGVGHGVVGAQIDLLIFDAAPQPLDEHVVAPGAPAVHADGDAVTGEHAGERRAGELRALVGVEDVRLAVASESILQRLDAECGFHRDRDAPRQHPTGRSVEDNSQVHEAPRHRDVDDVHRPDLVRARDLHAAQQIWIDLVSRLGLGGGRPAVERLYPQPPHERFDMPAADLAPLGSQQVSQHSRTGERKLQMQPVEPLHDCEIGVRQLGISLEGHRLRLHGGVDRDPL